MSTKNLLVELFVEELPPKSLKKLGESFAEVLSASLVAQGLALKGTEVTAYATPRRLAVRVDGVFAQAADKSVSQKLMPVKVGLDAEGMATPALLKKLASLGADASVVPELKREMDGPSTGLRAGGAEVLYFDSMAAGAKLADGLQKALDEALAKLPIARVMTYPDPTGDGWPVVNFVRPAHSLVALHGRKIVPVSVLGLTAGNTTRGHRFEAAIDVIVIEDADSYARQLEEEGAVIAGFATRRAEISRQLEAAAAREGLKPIADDALLDEVTALVERPNVLTGAFEEIFLEVPQECLILTMKANQKYFPLLDAKGKLTNKFLIVSNIRPADASLVIGGNERVVRPRLADAKFFFDQDRKKPLDARVLGLSRVVYHNKLGSQGERVERVQAIARSIGLQLGGEALALQADQAALLAKADLLTDMVGEFPELQGIMGRYYAQHDGLPDDIAYAIEDHYKPRFAGDELPRNLVGICVALADKLETLVGMFSIGNLPTGDKDPFALRRHAQGVVRILLENSIRLEIGILVTWAWRIFPESQSGAIGPRKALLPFFMERLSGVLEAKGFSVQQIDAVLQQISGQFIEPSGERIYIYQIPVRLAAVRIFVALPEAPALASANKRIGNILKKVEGEISSEVHIALLQEPAEIALFEALKQIKPLPSTGGVSGDFTGTRQYDLTVDDFTAYLQSLAALREPVDAFFDSVMVNAEDRALRANRLALLAQLHTAMNRVADLSRLAA